MSDTPDKLKRRQRLTVTRRKNRVKFFNKERKKTLDEGKICKYKLYLEDSDESEDIDDYY